MQEYFEIYSDKAGRTLPDFYEDEKLSSPQLYRPSEALRNAVNVAIMLGKPLLLTGEPGCGKTQLAYSIAASLGLESPLVYNTRTTSSATDLFYKYNAIGHFQYSQNKQGNLLDDTETEKRFIRYQALGEAIRSNQRRVVLIDEIDKAPRDLPNDILNILEELAFDVPEIGKSYRSEKTKRPIIVLTSNSEKNLPDAFLRRCVFFHINFPTEAELLEILSAKLQTELYSYDIMKRIVVPHFMEIRSMLQKKKPGTAELIYWVSLLNRISFDPQRLLHYRLIPPQDKKTLLMTYHVLAKNETDFRILQNLLNIEESVAAAGERYTAAPKDPVY